MITLALLQRQPVQVNYNIPLKHFACPFSCCLACLLAWLITPLMKSSARDFPLGLFRDWVLVANISSHLEPSKFQLGFGTPHSTLDQALFKRKKKT